MANNTNTTGKQSYPMWEEGVANSLSDKLEISFSDAQGIIESNEFYMAQAWAKGMDSKQTADYIDSKSSMAKGGGVKNSVTQKEYLEYLTDVSLEMDIANHNLIEYLKSKGLSSVGLLPDEIKNDSKYKDLKRKFDAAKGKASPKVNPKLSASTDRMVRMAALQEYKKILANEVAKQDKMAKGGGVKSYEIYHKTLASVLDEIENYAERNHYTFTSEYYFPDVTSGGIKYGETKKFGRPIIKEGKNKEGQLYAQVYRMDSGTYELTFYPSFKRGGSIEDENLDMVKSQNKAISHHTKELQSQLNMGKDAPAWVVSKVSRASNDLSDVTHYLDGEKMANGGGIHKMSEKDRARLDVLQSKEDYHGLSESENDEYEKLVLEYRKTPEYKFYGKKEGGYAKGGKVKYDKTLISSLPKNRRADKNYTHFAVRKSDNKILNGWDYSDYDSEDLNTFKKSYFYDDMDDMDVPKNEYTIKKAQTLIRLGVNPFDFDNWRNLDFSNDKPYEGKMANGGNIDEWDEEQYPSRRKMLESILSKEFGNMNQYSSSADWGGIPVWSLSGDDLEGAFIGIGDDDGLFIVEREQDYEEGDTKETEIMTASYNDIPQMKRLIAKAKTMQVKMADGGVIRGSNNKTGERFGVVIGSETISDEYVENGLELNVRKVYGNRTSESKLIFDEKGNLNGIVDYGYSLDGLPNLSYGRGTYYGADKKKTIKILSDIYTPSFAKNLVQSVYTKMAKGGKMAYGGGIETTNEDRYNCYTTGYDGRKNTYGNEDDLTLEDAVDYCWRFSDVKRNFANKEDLEKEIKSTPYGKNNIIASSGNITGVVVYKLVPEKKPIVNNGNSDNEVVSFFKNIDYSKLPPAFSEYIKNEVLTDADLQYLSPKEPVFLEIKKKVENYTNKGATTTTPITTGENENVKKYNAEIEDLNVLIDIESDESQIAIYKQEIEDLQTLIELES